MLKLSERWAQVLSQPETGMGYHVVTVLLKNGQRYEQVVIVGGRLTMIRGLKDIPFTDEDIAEIRVTHAKWAWNKQ